MATTLFALPLIAMLLFCLALTSGLHHPPWMVPPGWQWPPFQTFRERLTHAFALSIWAFVFGTPTMVFCGIVRRTAAYVATPMSKQ